jgi:putative transposase
MARASLRYQGHRDPQEALRMRLRELAASWVRFGYRRLTVLLRRDGWRVNAKRIYRLYTEEGLMVRTKVRVRAARRNHVPQAVADQPGVVVPPTMLVLSSQAGRFRVPVAGP